MYARRGQSMQLDEHKLLLNGLQPLRRLRDRVLLTSERPNKRQRTENLNSRYDRMIQTVNTMHPEPAYTSHHKDRHREASSSSATTNDAPRTPESAYSLWHSRSLGGEFSILKKSGSGPSVKRSDPCDPAAFTGMSNDADRSTKSLPSWLMGTISTLETQNPLRLLLPDHVAALEGSSQYSLRPSNGTNDHDPENVPFTHTSPITLPAGFTFVEEPTSTTSGSFTKSTPFAINKEHATWSSNVHEHRDETIALELPFSTPGPTSITSPLARPVLARSPAYVPPRSPTVSSRAIDASISSEFVPFAKPGPCSSTEHAACPPVATSLYRNQQYVTSPNQGIASSALNSLESPSHILPFSTPGPLPPPVKETMSTYANAHFVKSPARDHLTFHTWPSLHDQRQQRSTPDLLYSSPASMKRPIKRSLASPRSSSPRSSSVERSPFSSWEEHNAPAAVRLHSPLVPYDRSVSAHGNVDHNTLDFRWERFDRGDTVADSTWFSSPRALPGSEETFWSQPARHLPDHLDTLAQRRDYLRLDSSPASLQLTGIPTPMPTSPHSPRNYFDSTQGAPSCPQDGNTFAWIVPPRHTGPPSTPQSKKSSSCRTPRTQAPPCNTIRPRLLCPGPEIGPANVRGGPQWQGRTSVTDLDASETRRPEPGPAERRVPFAPCSGIYISPLQNSPDIKAGAGNMNGAREESQSEQRPRHANGKQARSTGDRLPTSEGYVKDMYMSARYVPTAALHQDDGVDTPGTNAGKQSASQCTITVSSTQSHGNPYYGEEDEIEEEEEDQLEGCSQETRDTIESWTA